MLSSVFTLEHLGAFVTLTVLEIVLGIDNILFLSILVQRVPATQRNKARRIGLMLAMVFRILLLLSLSWVMHLKNALFTVFNHPVSGKDIILVAGGLFLMFKAAHEIFEDAEGDDDDEEEKAERERRRSNASFGWTLVQIVMFDIIFSLDSVITAVGIGSQVGVMIAAVVAAVFMMLFFAKPIGDFVLQHPSMKVLALSFLLMIGVLLIADGTGHHVSKAYVYFAMAFSFSVELLNMRARTKAKEAKANARAEKAAAKAALEDARDEKGA